MRFRLLIFDFDGTLADTFPALQSAMEEAIPHFRLRAVTAADLPELRSMGAREVIRFLGLPMWKVPAMARFVRAKMAAHPLRLFPGIADALRSLSNAGVTLAVVSSNTDANVRAGLGPELVSLFASFACGASLFGKPSRFRQVMKRTGHTPKETLAIGDELRDAEAARSAGIAFGAVSWGYTDAKGLQRGKPSLVFEDVSDLHKLVV